MKWTCKTLCDILVPDLRWLELQERRRKRGRYLRISPSHSCEMVSGKNERTLESSITGRGDNERAEWMPHSLPSIDFSLLCIVYVRKWGRNANNLVETYRTHTLNNLQPWQDIQLFFVYWTI